MNMYTPNSINTTIIKEEARRLGFSSCGVARADFLKEEAEVFESWLKSGYHGEMAYMEQNFDKRLDPRKLMEGARSVIVVSYNYFPPKRQRKDTYQLAKYAYGADYHDIVKGKLRALAEFLEQKAGPLRQRVFVDTAPIMEKVWAERAGLGWRGKHSILIQKRKGSYFSLGILLTSLEVEFDTPFQTTHCGTCNLCVEACPTEAILPGGVLRADRCISYLNTELKQEIPEEFRGRMRDYIFGCDICQNVCPWNRFALPHNEPEYLPPGGLLHMSKKEWEEMNVQVFRQLFKKSAVKRRKYSGLMRVIDFQKKIK